MQDFMSRRDQHLLHLTAAIMTELSGKIGGNFGITPNLGAYGELAFITADDDNNYGAKAGMKYNF